jgi:hypothetical protein
VISVQRTCAARASPCVTSRCASYAREWVESTRSRRSTWQGSPASSSQSAQRPYSRRKPKDWYDIAYVLLHNDAGGVEAAAAAVTDRFGPELESIRTALDDLGDNFADITAQGAVAYADEMVGNHPELDHRTLLADAVTAVGEFHASVTS